MAGGVDNLTILQYYNTHKIDCFIHTSEKEGLPVSIMEAESAGIPVVATNVGGIREMIDGNGVLLASDPDIDTVSKAVISCLRCPNDQKEAMSARSKEIWNEKFNARKNAVVFAEHVQSRFDDTIKSIVLITEGYPYDNSEKSFIESELNELLEHFDVYIIARVSESPNGILTENKDKNLDSLTDDQRKRLKGVTAYDRGWSPVDNLIYGIRYLFASGTAEERRDIIRSGSRIMIRFRESLKYYGKSVKFRKWIEKNRMISELSPNSTLYYTYWNLEPTLGLCLNRNRLRIKNLITRAHGYDYQDEQWEKSNRKPFMRTIDSLIDEIVFVSYAGRDYHIKKNGTGKDREYYVSYIGSNCASGEIHDGRSGKECDYRVVSCSSLIPLKRVHLIIDSLKKTDEELKNKIIE